MSEAKSFLQQLNDMFTRHEKSMISYHKQFYETYNKVLEDIKGTNPARNLIKIDEGVEYEKVKFFNLQCTETNTEECVIMTEYGEVTFPPNSFFKGAMYPINLLKLKTSGKAEFVGYIS